MKVGILAGGSGTRLSDSTQVIPKPLITIGGKPILWHLMRYYAHYGLSDFVVALGYRGELIKKYVVDFASLNSNLTVNLQTGQIMTHGEPTPDWTIDLVDTGITTMTGGRIKRLAPYLGNETFMLTWGDSLSNINLHELLAFHRGHGKLATLTAVRPLARFGHLVFDGDQVVEFNEKPQTAEGWINGAFFVLESGIFDYIDNDDTVWEETPLQRLAADGQLMAYEHNSFWAAVDTLRDKHLLEEQWRSGSAPWRV